MCGYNIIYLTESLFIATCVFTDPLYYNIEYPCSGIISLKCKNTLDKFLEVELLEKKRTRALNLNVYFAEFPSLNYCANSNSEQSVVVVVGVVVVVFDVVVFCQIAFFLILLYYHIKKF